MRVQILELPYNPDEPERPYAVIISEMPEGISAENIGNGIKDGADWLLCTTEKVELGEEWTMPARRFTSAIPPIAVGSFDAGFVEHFDGPTL